MKDLNKIVIIAHTPEERVGAAKFLTSLSGKPLVTTEESIRLGPWKYFYISTVDGKVTAASDDKYPPISYERIPFNQIHRILTEETKEGWVDKKLCELSGIIVSRTKIKVPQRETLLYSFEEFDRLAALVKEAREFNARNPLT